ncbi:MAG: hypothetical protein JEZ00_14480 [Anaerolineaceae bacterium]|nr:hypothetical protein [Anaerolineaceae bacterium]
MQRIFVHHPSLISSTGHINVPWVLELFIANAILFKGWAIIWLLIKRRNAKKSWVLIKQGKLIFRRKVIFPSEWQFTGPTCIEFHISKITSVFLNQKNIKIIGTIQTLWLNESGEVQKTEAHSECIIPAWFTDFDDLFITINAFIIR